MHQRRSFSTQLSLFVLLYLAILPSYGQTPLAAHRLNRAEYNNTVQDLLGVELRPAESFPQDDSGYGFDNIGAVLSLSPPQLAQYLAAAESLAQAAVFGPAPLPPTLQRYEAQGPVVVPSCRVPATYDRSGLLLPNALHTRHRFPVSGVYLFRMNLDGTRPLGSDPLQIALWLDGKLVKTLTVSAEKAAGFTYERQDFSGLVSECQLWVPAGPHQLAATVLHLYEGLPAGFHGPKPSRRPIPTITQSPRPGLSPQKRARLLAHAVVRAQALREAIQHGTLPANEARVRMLEIGGPFQQAKGPSVASQKRVFVCGHRAGGHSPACTTKILTSLARRAFRRPVEPHELARLSKLVALAQQKGDSYEKGICLALQAILVSPHFLFRLERSEARLSDHELASRLSYFLWSTMPDDQLLVCADNQTLRQPGVLAAQVRRMLQDPRSHALTENFAGQWLPLRALESHQPDPAHFPEFDPYLRFSMRRETELFFESVLHENRSIVTFLTGKETFLNERLANFYGISGVVGPVFRKVDLTGTPRRGILTQASVLTATSYPNRTSPVLRGKWILENLLNAPPPPPPDNIPPLTATALHSARSLRKQLELHRQSPRCAGCHASMDPLGLGLENFNAIGAWRQREGGHVIDASGTLPDGRSFQGPDGLGGLLLREKAAFREAFTTKLVTYALGRGLEPRDQKALTVLLRRSALQDDRFADLVQALVASPLFQRRQS